MKPPPPTLADWDRLQEKLADVMARVYAARMREILAPDQDALAKAVRDLEAEELGIRNEIATMSRTLRFELEDRGDG